jgi:hypothetical protein
MKWNDRAPVGQSAKIGSQSSQGSSPSGVEGGLDRRIRILSKEMMACQGVIEVCSEMSKAGKEAMEMEMDTFKEGLAPQPIKRMNCTQCKSQKCWRTDDTQK